MAAPATSDVFLELLRKSRLVQEERLDAYLVRKPLPEDPRQAATQMVRDGLITQFQAKQLLAGKHKGFFLGQYKFLDQIGSGGMGAVFLAEHTQMLRRVAIKILPPSKAQNESSLLRFKREAQAIAAVDHPNIVRAFDVGNEGGYHFLVLEYVEGVSLQELLNRGPLSVPHAANMIAQAALGLQHVHECGLIHRDIKPANLLLDRKGVVKILDLGLARMMIDEADDGLTRDRDGGVILGTADYLAPEQAINSSAVDIRADIYSLGITFYALLAGKPPFTDMTVAQKLLAHQLRPVVPLPTLRPDVPPELWAVIERMIAKDPAARFQTPGEVVQALLPWAQPVPLVMDTDDAFHLPTSSQLAGLRGGSQAGGSSKFHLDSLGRVPPGSTLALAPGAAAAISGGGSASSTQLIPALNPAAATPGFRDQPCQRGGSPSQAELARLDLVNCLRVHRRRVGLGDHWCLLLHRREPIGGAAAQLGG
jgi:serine/threonine protein kinase